MVLAVDDLQFHNQDIKAAGRVWLEADQNAPPFTYIRARFSEADGRSTSKYIPRNYLPLETQAWLDRGIKDGYVPEGEMQFHGRFRDIRELNREMAGEFFVDFELERGDVFFSPGWLHAKNGAGRVLFHNVSMDIDLDRVSYDQLDNARAKASIADLDKAVLDIRVETASTSALAVSTWLDTPVGKQYRRIMSNLHSLEGDVRSEVNLRMPLDQENPQPDVRVLVDFDNASAQSDNWGIDLSQVNGRLEVTPASFKARQIRAMYFGDPIKIDIDTLKPSGNTLLTARGKLEASNLLNKLPQQLTSNMHGKSNWRLGLNFAGISTPKAKPFLRLKATSSLENTAVELPQPFAKSIASSSRVSADIDFYQEQIWFEADFGNDIRGRGQLIPDETGDYKLNMLDIAFSSELKPKPRQGLHLYGSIAEVSVDDWVRFIKGSSGANPALWQTAELSFDRAHVFGREIDNVWFDLTQENERFVGSIESSGINGNFIVPWQASPQDPVIMDLDYLRIDRLEQETAEADLQPADLVDFRLSSKSLLFTICCSLICR